MNSFITAVELASILKTGETVVVDCRADLSDKDFGISSYNEAHIPGAKFIAAERAAIDS